MAKDRISELLPDIRENVSFPNKDAARGSPARGPALKIWMQH